MLYNVCDIDQKIFIIQIIALVQNSEVSSSVLVYWPNSVFSN